MKTKVTKISALLMLAFATSMTLSSCGDKAAAEETTEQSEDTAKCEEGKCEEGKDAKCEEGKCEEGKCEEGKKDEGMKCEEGKCEEGKK